MLAVAQVKKEDLVTKNTKSPGAETSVTINGKNLWIYYHAPSVRGRHIFKGAGALQPDGSVWRLGADYATVLHTDADLDLNGLAIPKGDYTLYVDTGANPWQLIVNKQTGQDGSDYDKSQDLGRVPMKISKNAAPVETYKMTLSQTKGNNGRLELAWENVVAAVDMTVQ